MNYINLCSLHKIPLKPVASSRETELSATRGSDAPSAAARDRPRGRGDPTQVLVQLLELDDVREDVLHDVLGVVRLHRQLLREPHDVGRLAHEVVQVGVRALVGDLRQAGLFRGERLVQVEQLQLRVRQLSEIGSDEVFQCHPYIKSTLISPERRGKDGGLKRGQRGLELRGDQLQWLVLHREFLVSLYDVWGKSLFGRV